MTRDEADTLLNILYERLENGALDYIEDGTLEALDMAIDIMNSQETSNSCKRAITSDYSDFNHEHEQSID